MFQSLLSEPEAQASEAPRKDVKDSKRQGVISALLKKTLLIKMRKPSAIIEFLIACVIWLIMYPVWKLARFDIPGNENPEVLPRNSSFAELAAFFAVTEKPTFVVAPDCNTTREFVDYLESFIGGVNVSNVTIYFKPQFVNSIEDMKTIIYSEDSNGLGIHWVNAEAEDATISPQIQIYKQSFAINPDKDLLELMTLYAAVKEGKLSLAMMSNSLQQYPIAPSDGPGDLTMMIAMYTIFPVILATLPDIQMILEEKDTRVQTLSFLMGCGEAAYWAVTFFNQLVSSIIPYVLMTICLCKHFVLVGTSLPLMLLIAILFLVAQIWFQLFVTTFMKKASHGRVITVIFLVLAVFFAYLHYFYTLTDENSSDFVKHILSVIPISSYQLLMMTVYKPCYRMMPAYQWEDLNRAGNYKVWWGIMWLVIDCLLYFGLFTVLNLIMPRDFGSPLLHWSELFSRDGWRKVFRKRRFRVANAPEGDETNEFIKVDGVSKTYNGERKVVALTDVSFSISSGEVIVIIGPNGAGKSTLMNIMSGAIEPSDGTLTLMGNAPTKRFKDIQDYLGVCFQDNVLIAPLSIKEHFALFGAFRRMTTYEIERSMNFFAETLQLTEMINNRAGDLSGGQKRKLCIALSLLGNPPIVIMDEPTAGVDVQARQLIWKTISQLEHTTTIVTSHALEEAEAVSNRLFVIAGGKMPFAGTATELREQFKCGYVLRVEGNVDRALELAQQYVPTAHISASRNDTIEIEVTKKVASFMKDFETHMDELGVQSFSFAVEQLEDVLLKLIEHEESAYQARM